MNQCKHTSLLRVILGISAILAAFSASSVAQAAASLAFSPQRIILAGTERATVLRLTNKGNKVGTFRISLVDLIYANDGSVKPAANVAKGFPTARPFVRFSPSQVRLRPGEAQNIRVLLKNSNSIPAGEHRVHVTMQEIPDISSSVTLKGKDKSIVATNHAIGQAVAIPLLVRRGTTSAMGAIQAASRTPKGVNLVLARSGNQSLYTNIEVYSGSIAQRNLIGSLKGVAVPVPNRQRALSIKVNKPSRQPYIVVVKDHDSGEILSQRRL